VKQPILLVQGNQNWLQVEAAALNTVVQIFAQVGKFNWLEPYKIESQYESRGTGFFINDQGYIVTNAHVINEAKTVWINVPALGRRTIRVDVKGFCPDRDLALLRVTDEDLEQIRKQIGRVPFLMLGDSDVVQRTDKVLVLGYPLGQHHLKSTTGVISGREATNSISYLQITAPVNPGNSGGPLIASDGSVIGITVAMIANAHSVGYVIPVNELKIVLEDMLKKPLLRKPLLGGQFHNTTDDHARFLGNPVPAGLYVHKVFKGSLLEKAGVAEGDMVYEFNGHKVDSHGEAIVPWSVDRVTMYDLISRLTLGQEIKLLLYRNGQKKEIAFPLEESLAYSVRAKFPDYEDIEHEVVGGMVVMELAHNHLPLLLTMAPDLIRYQKAENTLEPALIISHILPGSHAQRLRCIIPGDIIKTVNGMPVKTVEDFRKVLQEGAGREFLSLKTANDVLAVFPLKQMLAEERRLSEDFVYPLSKTVHELVNTVINGNKKTA